MGSRDEVRCRRGPVREKPHHPQLPFLLMNGGRPFMPLAGRSAGIDFLKVRKDALHEAGDPLRAFRLPRGITIVLLDPRHGGWGEKVREPIPMSCPGSRSSDI